jgi:hypothetical protein
MTRLTMRPLATLGYVLASLALAGAAAPCWSAQLYKWVDERGVTNYSNQPPVDPGAAKNLAPVAGNLSVYSPDPALMRAVAGFQQENNRGLAARVDYLERQLEIERLARQYAAPVAPVAAPCPSGDCSGGYGGYYSGAVGGGFFPIVGHKHKRLIPAQLPVGATAGNVVGNSGFIPGQSALAASLAPPRPAQVSLPLEPGRRR